MIPIPVSTSAEILAKVDLAVPETDSNYSLTVQPNWLTSTSVPSKKAGGFAVEFSVPAPAGGTIDWQLIR